MEHRKKSDIQFKPNFQLIREAVYDAPSYPSDWINRVSTRSGISDSPVSGHVLRSRRGRKSELHKPRVTNSYEAKQTNSNDLEFRTPVKNSRIPSFAPSNPSVVASERFLVHNLYGLCSEKDQISTGKSIIVNKIDIAPCKSSASCPDTERSVVFSFLGIPLLSHFSALGCRFFGTVCSRIIAIRNSNRGRRLSSRTMTATHRVKPVFCCQKRCLMMLMMTFLLLTILLLCLLEPVPISVVGDVKTMESFRSRLDLLAMELKSKINETADRLKNEYQRTELLTRSVNRLTAGQRQLAEDQMNHSVLSKTLETSLANMNLALNALQADATHSRSGVEHQEALVNALVKQALFVTTTSLNTSLERIRRDFEAERHHQKMLNLETFAQALEQLTAVINTQRVELDAKVEEAKHNFVDHQNSLATLLMARKSETSSQTVIREEEVLKMAKEFAEKGFTHLDFQIRTLNSRLASLEVFNTHLEDNFKQLSLKLADDRDTHLGVFEAKQDSQVAASLEALKTNLSASLRKKILDELQFRNAETDLQKLLLSLIKSIVDEHITVFFKDTPALEVEQVTGSYLEAVLDGFTADRTGQADFALASAGASVVGVRSTRTFNSGAESLTLFGFPIAYFAKLPNTILEPQVHPGECWCFHGNQGHAIIKLAVPTHVSGVTLEHVPKVLTLSGKIDSAPRDFVIKALTSEADDKGLLLGAFTFDQDDGSIQYFSIVTTTEDPVSHVELAILSNHGHMKYTCVYRLRVHGTIVDSF